MKNNPFIFTGVGVLLMMVLAVAFGLKIKKPVEQNPNLIRWSTTRLRADGVYVSYTWLDTTGNYPYTRDTFGLDSIEIDSTEYFSRIPE
jgi:hypothetical protein